MNEIKFGVDLYKPVKEQATLALKELKKVLPISMSKLVVAFKIPAQFAGKAASIVHKYDVKKEEWQKDGSLVVLLELPASVKQSVFNELNHLTHGEVESKIVEEKE